ncbi:DUF4287 domain-containing protein [Deinococcus hohokamensis]|uniref:DUF4287 domain-containing protein n=1 Tax=Deinococcus hohokamensis TaxID=309883 RepID=A0ABV9IDY0_9DEIO
MSFQVYLDAVHARTGKTVDDFRSLAEDKGLGQHGQIVSWLKQDFGLGHGHAAAVAAALLKADHFSRPKDEKVAALFRGKKSGWKVVYEALVEHAHAFGEDVESMPTDSSVSLTRRGKKFAIVQPGVARLDLGFKRPDVAATGRFEAAGTWNSMVTHRLKITDPAQVDAEVLGWLQAAYQHA